MKKEPWENTITLISLLAGTPYIIKKIYVKDYGSAEIISSNREWTSDNGEALILGKEEDILSIPNNSIVEIGNIRKILQQLYQENKSFVIGNNFYYPFGIEFENNKRLEVPTSLNNIIYYGNRKDLLGVVTKEVYNYVLFNNLDINEEDKEYLISKKKIKKNMSLLDIFFIFLYINQHSYKDP